MDPFSRIIGTTAAAENLRALGRRAACVDAPVFITGETGTGKGILARAIHDASGRRRAPFVQVNCAAISESLFESEFFGHVRGAFTGALQPHRGFFEQAHRGTLFLDEVAELPTTAQAKLLLSIESGDIRRVGAESAFRVDVRIIAATCRDLASALETSGFRRDLYHRLAVFRIHIPPLRSRVRDIRPIAEEALRRALPRFPNATPHLPEAGLDILEQHDWPGNVRELIHALEAALARDDRLTPDNLRAAIQLSGLPVPADPLPAPRTRRYSHFGSHQEERDRIEAALRACNGNRTHAARMLGMSRNTLLARIYRYGLDAVPSSHGRPLSADASMGAAELRNTVENR